MSFANKAKQIESGTRIVTGFETDQIKETDAKHEISRAKSSTDSLITESVCATVRAVSNLSKKKRSSPGLE